MTTPTPIKYIYKILPLTPPPPSPLPLSLPVSSLDSGDGYIHASTSIQLLGTLKKFFKTAEGVWILRLDYTKLREQGVVKWETTKGEPGSEGQEGCFPHLYNGLKVGREEVDSVGEWKRGEEEWGVEGWPFGGEDVPK